MNQASCVRVSYFSCSYICAAQLVRVVPDCPSLKAVVFLTDRCAPVITDSATCGEINFILLPARQHMPVIALPCPVLCYEEILDAQLGRLPGFK
jgi:hypothetical protein